MPKNVAILGSTGSIGTSALRVLESLGPDFRVVALAARDSIEALADQVRRFRVPHAAVTNPKKADAFRRLLGDVPCRIHAGPDALEEMAVLDEVDIVLTAVVGAAGLPAVLRAAEKGKTLAIANKEPLVIAGRLLTETARAHGARILPIDSEHSAVFQTLQAGDRRDVRRIILTASGGPFRNARPEDLAAVRPEQALAHPTWNMGPKITIDSATMMNKALEILEAVWLFDVPVEKVDVLIHPESIVHSMVEFVDGAIVAQLGTPDMTVPIQYALTYPRRRPSPAAALRLEDLGCLTFERPDTTLFRSLELAYEVARLGGTAPAVFNAANEVAVDAFLADRITFAHIVETVEACLEAHTVKAEPDLDDLYEADAWARDHAGQRAHAVGR